MENIEKKKSCRKYFKNKLEDFGNKFVVCLLSRFGIVTPTIFR